MSTLFLDARFRSARLAAGVRLSPTARLQRKSTVCGLSGLRPVLQTPDGFPPTSEVVRQVEEEEAFGFARALR
jgi:hypothetical protein